MKSLSTEFKCPIVGGDVFFSKNALIITIALLGEIEKNQFKTRAGARAGDLIFVTGDLGGAEAGLRFLKKFSSKKIISSKFTAIRKHLWPYPRIKESRLLVKNLEISSMIDISDGLSSDLHHICEESEIGALIYADKIPISYQTTELCKLLNLSPLNTALSSGEEYELLFTLKPKDEQKLRKVIRGKFKISLIGRIIKKEKGVKILGQDGRIRDLKKTGYAHF
jgi:thiamine-monophosphate kinase